MKSVKVLGFSVLIAIVIVAGLNAQTNPQNPQPGQAATEQARLVGRSGTIEVQRGNAWVSLNPGAVINSGERVRTGSRSSGAIELGPGKVVTLSEKTEVQVRQSNGTPIVQLESGNMKVVSAEDIQVAAKETVIESTERPVEIEVESNADGINLTVVTGAVRNGPIVIRSAQGSSKRTYTAGERRTVTDNSVPYPYPVYASPFYPYVYANPYGALFPGLSPFPPQGTVPPVVFNPTHPAYRPDQIIPPMTNPLAVPITPAAPISPFRR
jgi:hypothetical protein